MSKFEKERQRKMSTKFNDFLKEQHRVSPEQEINFAIKAYTFVNRRYLEIIMKARIFAGFTLI